VPNYDLFFFEVETVIFRAILVQWFSPIVVQ
jgi:hypothetical protein